MDARILHLTQGFTPEQRAYFQQEYNDRKKDETTALVLAALGCLVVGGLQRFYLGKVGMGLLYLFTAGLLFIGTILDIVNAKKNVGEYNFQAATEIAMEMRALRVGEGGAATPAVPPS